MDRIPHTGRFPAFKKAIPIIAVFGNKPGKMPASWAIIAAGKSAEFSRRKHLDFDFRRKN